MINFPIAIKLFIKRWELSWRFRFAHHPICSNYQAHIWKIGGLYICQGCSLVYFSFLLTLLILIIFQLTFLPIQYILIGIVLLVPILLIEKLKLNKRFIKRFARSGTGIGIAVSFSAFLIQTDLIIKISGLLISILGFYAFKFIRRTIQRENRCQSCPDYQENKICYGLRLEADAMRLYSEYASDLLQKDLKAVYTKRLEYDN